MAKVTLHRCSYTFVHSNLDKCWKVQQELDAKGIEYEVVKHGWLRGKRASVVALSGQKLLPVIEFEDGAVYRAESGDMAERVRSGKLFDEPAR